VYRVVSERCNTDISIPQALVKVASTASSELPAVASSEDWAVRVGADEKWRQIGVPANKLILAKLTKHFAGRDFLLLLHQSIPIDWAMAAVDFNFVLPVIITCSGVA
jgi:hypothetical protein